MDNPHPARSHAARLASLLQVELDDYVKQNPDFASQSNKRGRAIFLICERGFDVVTPLLHEFTYQAMANDVLPIEEGKTYKYEFRGPTGVEEKKATLDEKDTIWTTIRHMHMKDTIDKLMTDFNKFLQENTNFTDKLSHPSTITNFREKATSLNDMRDMLATLPQFQETRDQYSLHLTMAEKCMEAFEEKKLLEVGLVEQVSLPLSLKLILELCYWSNPRREVSQDRIGRSSPVTQQSFIRVCFPSLQSTQI